MGSSDADVEVVASDVLVLVEIIVFEVATAFVHPMYQLRLLDLPMAMYPDVVLGHDLSDVR